MREISFEAWVAHVFDHEVRDPQWYFDIEGPYWDGPADVTIAYMTRLFENPIPSLDAYSDEQLNQGFWYLVSNSGSDHMCALLDEGIPLDARRRCVCSFSILFEQVFARRCSSHVSHLDEPGVGPLNSACYMWWDIIPIYARPDDAARRELDEEILGVMERILNLDSVPCQESALHGLGHWRSGYPARVDAIIDRFIAGHPDLRTDLLNYARQARTGCVL